MTEAINIPEEIKNLYPFTPQSFTLTNSYKMSYVDEGQGPIVLLLHGNPTWSFAYRDLIKKLSPHYRVIAPDHIGMGLSEKPQDYSYQLDQHIENIYELIQHLKIEDFHLVVHDWGGAIGAGLALKNPQRLKSWVILNTAAFTSTHIPFRINICRNSLGEQLIRRLNAFAAPATLMAVKKPLSKTVKDGYLYPYQNYSDRIATARFVRDIPMNKNHPTHKTLLNIEQNLNKLDAPKLILWGKKDFCFNDHFLKRWQEFYPDANVKIYEDAGHYVFEDEKSDVNEQIFQFISQSQMGQE